MNEKVYCGKTVKTDPGGYLLNTSDWSVEIAREIATEDGIILSDIHFSFLMFIRSRFLSGKTVTIRCIMKSGIADLRTFYSLFPGAALKKASKIAGIPKPENCI